MFDPEYQRDIDYTYLTVPFTSSMESELSLQMLLSNRIMGFLPLSKKAVNGNEKLYYDITARQSLQKLHEDREWGYDEAKRLIVSIYLTLQKMKEYLLNENGILLNPEYLFYHVEEQNYAFVFYPDTESSFREQFHGLTEYLLGRIDYEDDRAVEFVQYLYRESKNENFTLKAAFDYLTKGDGMATNEVTADEEELMSTADGIPERTEQESYGEYLDREEADKNKMIGVLVTISLAGSLGVFLYVLVLSDRISIYAYILLTFFLSVLGICLWEKRIHRRYVKEMKEILAASGQD